MTPEAPASHPTEHHPTEQRPFVWLFSLVAFLAAIPFFAVEFPPIHDLPHHLAQARLYTELGDPATSPYRTVWLAPQNLIYVVLLPLWTVLSPVAAGKALTYLVLLGTVAALFHLAYRRGRSPEAALVASLFAFNFLFYAGFFAFQLGGVFFLLWLSLEDRDMSPLRWGGVAVLLFALAWAHAFWLAFVLLVLGLRLAGERFSRRAWIRASTALPAFSWLAPQLLGVVDSRVGGGFPMEPHWAHILKRLEPAILVDGFLGGVRGGVEVVIILAVLAWLAAAARAKGPELREHVDRKLLLVAGALLATWSVAPDGIAMTLEVARRWLPYAAMVGVLAMPVPALSRRRLRVAGAALHLILFLTAMSAWRFYDRAELGGFREGLASLPEGASVLGLGLAESQVLKGGVLFQTHAWAQVLKGAELDLSFTDLGAGIVLRKEPRERPWSYPLSLRPVLVEPRDVLHFEYVLVAAGATIQSEVAAFPGVSLVTDGIPWRLYRVTPPNGVEPTAGGF